jgi:hypothetical protein
VPTLVKVPEELFDRYILYDDAPLTAFQLTVIPDADFVVVLTPDGAVKIMSLVVPLTVPDCAPSVPPPVTALTA